MIGLSMNDEPERIWKRMVVAWLCRQLPGGTENNRENPDFKIASVLADARKDYLPNESLNRIS
jgi:hypothetical protein